MFEWLEDPSPLEWVGFVGTVGTVLGLGLAVYFYRKTLPPKPAYQVHALRILEADTTIVPKGIRILFNGDEVSRITKTYVVLWNNGPRTLRNASIVRPITMSFDDDSKILRARVVSRTKEVNEFQVVVTEDKKEAICNLRYLDSNDGAILELLHTSKQRYPHVHADIEEVPSGIENRGEAIIPPVSSVAALRAVQVFLRRATVRTPWGTFRPFRTIVGVGSVIIRLGLIILALLMLLWSLNYAAVEHYLCSPPSQTQTLEECQNSVPSFQWLTRGFALIPLLLASPLALWRRRKGPPSKLDLSDIL